MHTMAQKALLSIQGFEEQPLPIRQRPLNCCHGNLLPGAAPRHLIEFLQGVDVPVPCSNELEAAPSWAGDEK